MLQPRTKEEEIRDEILRLLGDGHLWSNANIKRELAKSLPLSLADKGQANHRPNESKMDQIVNNALSPSRDKSLVAQKLVETPKLGRHRITDLGRKELQKIRRFDGAFAEVNASPDGQVFLREVENFNK